MAARAAEPTPATENASYQRFGWRLDALPRCGQADLPPSAYQIINRIARRPIWG